MITRFILLIIAAATAGAMSTMSPAMPDRALSPLPEPVLPGVVYRVHLPFVKGADLPLVEGADATLYGYASPHRRAYEVTHYNWGAFVASCENANFWPMIWSHRNTAPDACNDGRMLLILNEPEAPEQANTTPEQAAALVREWTVRWQGPIACCGTGYIDGGVRWFFDFLAAYDRLYGEVPEIDYLHIHVYAYSDNTLNVDALRGWKVLSEVYGWPILVTEAGTNPWLGMDNAAEHLPSILATIEEELQPVTLFWFSDYLQPNVNVGGWWPWWNLSLTNIDNSLTPVGEAWQRYTGETIESYLSSRAVAR